MTTTEKPLDVSRLKLAWECILPQFGEMACEASKSEGPGMSIFRMLKSTNPSGSNCEFYYCAVGSVPYNDMLSHSPLSKAIKQKYNSSTHYMIAVCVPTSEIGVENIIVQIRLFDMITNKEVPVEEENSS